MKFVFGYAGIPSVIYDDIYVRRSWIGGDTVQFVSTPLKAGTGKLSYKVADSNFFLRKFSQLIESDHHDQLNDTGFGLIYIDYPGSYTTDFVKRFFPFLLCIPIQWEPEDGTVTNIRRSKNKLLNLFQYATRRAKDTIVALKKELTERDSHTPLLLPVRNFYSGCLVDELDRLQRELPNSGNKVQAISESVKRIEQVHPRQRIADGYVKGGSFFLDSRNIRFKPPGRDRHGYARSGESHPEFCLLSSRRRLGAPYDRVFHYDCTRGSGVLKDHFFGCHEELSLREGNPHLNIAPNDFVRG